MTQTAEKSEKKVGVTPDVESGEEGRISPKIFVSNIFVLYGFAGIALSLPYWIGPYRRGFFCNDESIQLPYKENTISTLMLFLLSFGYNVTSTIFAEYVVQYKIEKNIPLRRYRWKNRSFHGLFVHCMMEIGYSQMGFVAVVALMNVTKFCMGRLRPHFIDVCQPENFTEICSDPFRYVPADGYHCTGNPVMIREGRLSFFSGHSAISMYCAIYAVIYLQARIGKHDASRLAVYVIQTLFTLMALVVCLTRITDNWHHWSDVLAGIAVGIIVATWTAVCWARLFDEECRVGRHRPLLPVHRQITECENGSDTRGRESPSSYGAVEAENL